MRFTIALIIAASAFLANASPGPAGDSVMLYNGDKVVEASTEPEMRRRDHATLFNGEKNVDVTDDVEKMKRDTGINCKGSTFCERLGGSCDDAKRKVYAENTYGTFTGAEASGTCSGTCGLFVSGDHCTIKGAELIKAYDSIRKEGSCTHCGQKKVDDGCTVKIDRINGCSGSIV